LWWVWVKKFWVSHLWFGFGFENFPLKMSNFSIFSYGSIKIFSCQVKKYRSQRQVGLLFTAGRVRAHLYLILSCKNKQAYTALGCVIPLWEKNLRQSILVQPTRIFNIPNETHKKNSQLLIITKNMINKLINLFLSFESPISPVIDICISLILASSLWFRLSWPPPNKSESKSSENSNALWTEKRNSLFQKRQSHCWLK